MKVFNLPLLQALAQAGAPSPRDCLSPQGGWSGTRQRCGTSLPLGHPRQLQPLSRGSGCATALKRVPQPACLGTGHSTCPGCSRWYTPPAHLPASPTPSPTSTLALQSPPDALPARLRPRSLRQPEMRTRLLQRGRMGHSCVGVAGWKLPTTQLLSACRGPGCNDGERHGFLSATGPR